MPRLEALTRVSLNGRLVEVGVEFDCSDRQAERLVRLRAAAPVKAAPVKRSPRKREG